MRIHEHFTTWWLRKKNQELFDALFFDIDGTLLSGYSKALPGALELIRMLRKRKFPFKLITNDGNHSLLEKSTFLRRAGFDIREEEIVSCALALSESADRYALHGKRVFVMGDLGKPLSYAAIAGMIPTNDLKEIGHCSAIIVGEGYYDWHEVIQKVLNTLIHNPSIPFLVPNPDSYWPDGKGGFGIGAGGKARFIAGLLKEMGIRKEPDFLGKPHAAVFQHAIREITEEFGLKSAPTPDRILMIGDFPPSDIRGANNSGLASALVLSGVTKKKQLDSLKPEETPDYIFNTLG